MKNNWRNTNSDPGASDSKEPGLLSPRRAWKFDRYRRLRSASRQKKKKQNLLAVQQGEPEGPESMKARDSGLVGYLAQRHLNVIKERPAWP